MTKDPKSYTHEELVTLLQRSLALDEARKDRPYSAEDLAAAAKELGLDPKALAIAETSISTRREAKALAPRPFNTRVELEAADDRFVLRIPPVRPTAKTLAPIGFAGFWLTFIAFWTHGAAQGSSLFAAFSIPFWIVGAAMLGRFVPPLFQTTTLELGRDKGTIQKSPLGRKRHLLVRVLSPRLGKHVRWQQRRTEVANGEEPALLLEHGTETIPLLLGFSDQEQRWVAAELQAWLPPHADPP